MLLGHTNLNTTAIYMRVKDPTTHPVLGQLDLLEVDVERNRSQADDADECKSNSSRLFAPETHRVVFDGNDGADENGGNRADRHDPPAEDASPPA
jgi:hypothetical protein